MASKKNEPVKSALAISINLLPPEFRKKQKDFTWVTDRRIIWPTVALIVSGTPAGLSGSCSLLQALKAMMALAIKTMEYIVFLMVLSSFD